MLHVYSRTHMMLYTEIYTHTIREYSTPNGNQHIKWQCFGEFKLLRDLLTWSQPNTEKTEALQQISHYNQRYWWI